MKHVYKFFAVALAALSVSMPALAGTLSYNGFEYEELDPRDLVLNFEAELGGSQTKRFAISTQGADIQVERVSWELTGLTRRVTLAPDLLGNSPFSFVVSPVQVADLFVRTIFVDVTFAPLLPVLRDDIGEYVEGYEVGYNYFDVYINCGYRDGICRREIHREYFEDSIRFKGTLIAPVPLPAGGVLGLSALGFLIAMRRRAKIAS